MNLLIIPTILTTIPGEKCTTHYRIKGAEQTYFTLRVLIFSVTS